MKIKNHIVSTTFVTNTWYDTSSFTLTWLAGKTSDDIEAEMKKLPSRTTNVHTVKFARQRKIDQLNAKLHPEYDDYSDFVDAEKLLPRKLKKRIKRENTMAWMNDDQVRKYFYNNFKEVK